MAITLGTEATPSNPSSGYEKLFVDSADGKIKTINSSGTVVDLTTTGTGDVVGPSSSVDSEIALFNSTTGKLIKRASGTGIAHLASGVLSASNIVNADVDSAAAIAYSKLNLSASVVNADIASAAGIAVNKLAALTASRAVKTDSSGFLVSSTATAAALDALSGTNTGDQTITLTGDVTGSGTGSFSATIASNAVTNAKLAQIATATFKGRTTAGTGNVEDLTATQATALLNAMVGDSGSGGTKGLVPAPGVGDATKFLRGDGTFATPSGTGDFSSNTATSVDSEIVLFSGTGGKTGKRSTGTGIARLTSGVLSAVSNIANADIDASAAIAYSKLNLATSIVNADISASAAIVDTKLATISTSGKVSNSATTATNANTASAIVARDANGDFTARDITQRASILNGTGGAGFEEYPTQSSNPSAPATGFREFADSTGRKSWIRASDGFVRTWDATLTASRVYTLPDATTTVVGTDVTQDLTNKNYLKRNASKTANYTLTNTDDIIFVDTSGGAFNITLPSPSTNTKKTFTIKDKAGSLDTNRITIVRNGSEKIDNVAASYIFAGNYASIDLYSDGTDWWII